MQVGAEFPWPCLHGECCTPGDPTACPSRAPLASRHLGEPRWEEERKWRGVTDPWLGSGAPGGEAWQGSHTPLLGTPRTLALGLKMGASFLGAEGLGQREQGRRPQMGETGATVRGTEGLEGDRVRTPTPAPPASPHHDL